MNRPDAAPQPRHAIEHRRGVVGSGAPGRERRVRGRGAHAGAARARPPRAGIAGSAAATSRRSSCTRSAVDDALPRLRARRARPRSASGYTPRLADHVARQVRAEPPRPPTWSAYIGFDHTHARLPATSSSGGRSPTRSTATRSRAVCPANLVGRDGRHRARRRSRATRPTSRSGLRPRPGARVPRPLGRQER